MAQASELLALARAEIGTKEVPAGSNRVKYNTDYYGREISGLEYSWCAVFLWWLFQQAGAPELYYGGRKTAYVPALLTFAKNAGELADIPQPGDLICFDFNNNGVADHIGICESFDGKYVTTIDGNTGVGNEANGGAVMRRSRDKKYIVGVIRPAYETEEEEMTQQEFDRMMADYIKRQAELEPSQWSKQARAWAEDAQIISGDEQGRKQYKKFCTREELIQILYNAQQ